jgi:hypothetical protein
MLCSNKLPDSLAQSLHSSYDNINVSTATAVGIVISSPAMFAGHKQLHTAARAMLLRHVQPVRNRNAPKIPTNTVAADQAAAVKDGPIHVMKESCDMKAAAPQVML